MEISEEVFYNKELSDSIRDITVNSACGYDDALQLLSISNDYNRDIYIIKKLYNKGFRINMVHVIISVINTEPSNDQPDNICGDESNDNNKVRLMKCVSGEETKIDPKTTNYRYMFEDIHDSRFTHEIISTKPLLRQYVSHKISLDLLLHISREINANTPPL